MEKEKLNYIQSLGTLLSIYYSDLIFINNFKKLKEKVIICERNISQETGSFKSFLDMYKVSRNIEPSKTMLLLETTLEWVRGKNTFDVDNVDNVDSFVNFLIEKDVTKKRLTSLCSKILFLNNPQKILPMDTLVREALNKKDNNYDGYLALIEKFKKDNKKEIEAHLKRVEPYLVFIEKGFSEVENIEQIRLNRFIDAILFNTGKRKLNEKEDIKAKKKVLKVQDMDFSDVVIKEMKPAPEWMIPYLQDFDIDALEGRNPRVRDMKKRWQESEAYKELYGEDTPHTEEDNDL